MIHERENRNQKRSCTKVFIIAGFALVLAVGFLPGIVAGVNCSLSEKGPTAAFTYTVTPSDMSPITVHFSSTSMPGKMKSNPVTGSGGVDPIVSYRWHFDNGFTDSSFSSSKDPVHTYAKSTNEISGKTPYKVTLTVTSECGKLSTISKDITVSCTCPEADYTLVPPAGGSAYTAPATVVIRDASTHAPAPVTTYSYWLYRNGAPGNSGIKYEKNPTFTIPASGQYYIMQSVSKICSKNCMSDTMKTIYFNVTDPVTLVTTTQAMPVTTTETEAATTTVPVTYAAPTQVVAPVTTSAAPTVTTTMSPASGTPAQPATAASPGTGTLSVATNPAGAQVFVDDVMRGLSPASIPELSAGSHTLRLEKSGYHTMTVPVSIGDGRTTEYSTALEAESGGMGIVPIIIAVLVIVAGAGAAYWYFNKKSPGTGEQK